MSFISNYNNIEESLEIYLKEARKFPTLTISEEIELGRRIQGGDLEAREILARSNLRLVLHYAKKYRGCDVPFSDLVSYGNEGLIKAINKYNYRKGIKFSTFASQSIQGEIKSCLRDSLSHIPRNKFQYWLKVKELKDEGYSIEDISHQVGELPLNKVNSLLNYYDPSQNISIIAQNEKGDEFDLTSDERSSPDSCLNLLREKLFSILGEYITTKESEMLKLYYGFYNEKYNLKEVGALFGITESRTCQIITGAMKKLRTSKCLSKLEKCLNS